MAQIDDQEKDRIGANLRSHRLARSLSQAAVAKVAGCNQMSMSNYEGGVRLIPLAQALAVARHYGITVDELLNTENPNADPEQLDGLGRVRRKGE